MRQKLSERGEDVRPDVLLGAVVGREPVADEARIGQRGAGRGGGARRLAAVVVGGGQEAAERGGRLAAAAAAGAVVAGVLGGEVAGLLLLLAEGQRLARGQALPQQVEAARGCRRLEAVGHGGLAGCRGAQKKGG